MTDIFISYSSNDREQAMMLSELLTSAGLSVWIDRQDIDAATIWSSEIVDAINACRVVIVLLSPASNGSKNVAKEVALAAERNKQILPLDLEPVLLSRDLAYHLAGIQRAPMTNIDSIIRALGRLGLEATSAPVPPKVVQEASGRKTLMILPFEDLSPTGDNGWFADGIVSELISALMNVKALKVVDQQATKEYRRYKGTLPVYAREMGIRYFVQGDVRKFGDSIKITARLLDIDTGDHLWQESIKSTMADIFEVQESVAEKVVEGLKLHLTNEEKKKLADHGTENTEAYELRLKASEYYTRQTKEGFLLAINMCSESIRLDPMYAYAYILKANALASLYRTYDPNPMLLTEAESLCEQALRLKPDLVLVYNPLSVIYSLQGYPEKAEQTVKEYIRKVPEDFRGYFALGFLYANSGRPADAIAQYEQAMRFAPDDRPALFNLVVNCNSANEHEKCRMWAQTALPVEERYLRLHPDDEGSRMQYAVMLHFSGRTDDALREATILMNARDGSTLYNTANLFLELKHGQEGLEAFRRALEAGFRNMRLMKLFLAEARDDIAGLEDTMEYAEVAKLIETIERDTVTKDSVTMTENE